MVNLAPPHPLSDTPLRNCHDGPKQCAVLMTVHNRREKTLMALRRLEQQAMAAPGQLTVFLVDDGSTDGTRDAVRGEFPDVRIIAGDGSLFWNGGMRKAFASALNAGFEGYLWLNDDTMLDQDACERLLTCASNWSAQHGPAITIGSVKDPVTMQHAYGGFHFVRHGLMADLIPVIPDSAETIQCDTMNGNFVYIPQSIAQVLGNLEAKFRHQIGDVDYGLRARSGGFDVVIAPGYFGVCQPNSADKTWRNERLPFRERWRNLMSCKGAAPREWLLFVTRHYGWRWPLYAASPYLKTVWTSMWSFLKKR